MPTDKKQINLVWLKRDLRLEDNEAIVNAFDSKHPVLLLYIFEQVLIEDAHYSMRHWDFIKQSLLGLNKQLEGYDSKILIVSSDIIAVVNQLLNHYQIKTAFLHGPNELVQCAKIRYHSRRR